MTTDRAVPAAPEKNRAFRLGREDRALGRTGVSPLPHPRTAAHGHPRDQSRPPGREGHGVPGGARRRPRGTPGAVCLRQSAAAARRPGEHPEADGKAWPGYRASDVVVVVVVVEPSSKPVDEFVMVDPENGDWFTRPAGRHRRRGQEDRSARGHEAGRVRFALPARGR
ncbi:DUF6777 domain-containing protein [Streptomyces bacillaris]|uniref:DUF6777 domain-containing protein n=1 Tax=Streptomyces bacillaris TaxID=68179 RepID=UPI003F4D7D4F